MRLLVAVADVASLVADGSAIDEHARHNTTSVYTAGGIFPMLPEKLSTDLTSLNPDEDRLALVVEMVIDARRNASEIRISTGRGSPIMPSWPTTAWPPGWMGAAAVPEALAAVKGLDENPAPSGSDRPEHEAAPACPRGAQPGNH